MQKWIIPADIKICNVSEYYCENGFLDWRAVYNYEIGDIIYIYYSKPIQKIMFKTRVEKKFIYETTGEDGVILNLIKKVDKEELSFEKLMKNGLTHNIMGPMKLSGDLENYVEKYFDEKEENNMWVVIAGEDSVKIDVFKENNFVGIGWNLSDLSGKSKKDIRKEYENLYPDDSPNRTGQIVSQIGKFVKDIKVGDYIISVDSLKKEYYVGKCTSDYYFSDEKDTTENIYDKYKHCRDVEWLCTKIKRYVLSEKAIKKLTIGKSVSQIIDNAVKEEVLDFVKFKPVKTNKSRNLIYFGAPGTGKSFNLNNEIKNLLKCYENNYERVTFHPDYTYSNFVGTYKPVPKGDSEISYEFVPGPFMRILVKALQKPSQPFALIIEEINRANVAAVFGDVFQLLDRDNMDYNSEYQINASEDMKNYLKTELKCNQCYVKSILGEDYDKLIIPQNMFIWATMNSADQGVFPMDTAFKRRWDFKYIGIDDGEDEIKNLKVILNYEEIYWNNLRKAINNKLLTFGINEDKLMGPFFAFKEFIGMEIIPENKFNDIFMNKIVMYLFEDAARSKRDVLFKIDDENIKNITFSQIRNAFHGKKGIRIFSDDVVAEIFNNKIE